MRELGKLNNSYSDHAQLFLPVWPVQVLIVQYNVVIDMNPCRLPQYIELKEIVQAKRAK